MNIHVSDMIGIKSQIDFIMLNKKWKNSLKNCEAYSTFSSLGSDHRVVTAKIRLSLRMCKTRSKTVNYDWSALKNEEIQRKYTVAVRNRYEALCSNEQSVTETAITYENFIKANTEVAEKIIPKKKIHRKKHLSEQPGIIASREKVKEAFASYQVQSNPENLEILKREKDKLQSIYDTYEEEELSQLIEMVEKSNEKSQHGQSWKLINIITGRKHGKKGIINGTSKADRVQKWYKHFKDLLGGSSETGEAEEDISPVLKDLDISDDLFTVYEYLAVKKKLLKIWRERRLGFAFQGCTPQCNCNEVTLSPNE